MQVPQLVIIDASLVFIDEKTVDPSLQELITTCTTKGVPVYLVGTGYDCIRVPEQISEQVYDILRIKHCADNLEWLRLSTLHNVLPRHIFYVSPRQPHCAQNENFGMVWIPEGISTFVPWLKKTLIKVSRNTILRDAFEMAGK